MFELDPVDRITTGAVGEPGNRVFYLQGRKGDKLVTLLVEKEHVRLLSVSVIQLLAGIEGEGAEVPPEHEMELEEPLAPEWRVGRLGLGYDESRDLVVIEAEELIEDEPEAPEEGDRERVRFWATREQMIALARHGADVVAGGRPLCELCGFPLDPGEHICPALNGHRDMGEA